MSIDGMAGSTWCETCRNGKVPRMGGRLRKVEEWRKRNEVEVLRETERRLRGVEKERRRLREEEVVEESEGDRVRREDTEKRLKNEEKAAGRGRSVRHVAGCE